MADDVEEQGATPDVDPLLVAGVAVQNGATAYTYRAAFITPGAYTVAFTCSDDDATADDVLTFLPTKNVTVQPNVIATADFAPPAAP